mmetsp:Transcript_16337/g.46473  ORF Transcript_16337/g.46473 Transcript_16337/m.46473 type:complete len:114 (-) Transcript_16337:1007-1348(-)
MNHTHRTVMDVSYVRTYICDDPFVYVSFVHTLTSMRKWKEDATCTHTSGPPYALGQNTTPPAHTHIRTKAIRSDPWMQLVADTTCTNRQCQQPPELKKHKRLHVCIGPRRATP